MSEPVLQCRGLGRTYRDGDRSVEALNGVELDLLSGEKIAIVGASGSGKSTLLNLLGGTGYTKPGSGAAVQSGPGNAG